MRLIYIPDNSDRKLYLGINLKSYTAIESKSFGASYRNTLVKIEQKEFGASYKIFYGDSEKVFGASYIDNWRPTRDTTIFRVAYKNNMPQRARKIFKTYYKNEYTSPVRSFFVFQSSYHIDSGDTKTSYVFGDKYRSENTYGEYGHKEFSSSYKNFKAQITRFEFVSPYTNEQVRDGLARYVFSSPYRYIASTYSSSRSATEYDKLGNPTHKIKRMRPRYVSGKTPHILIPIDLTNIRKDKFSNQADISLVLNLPPKFFNYKIEGLDVISKKSYRGMKTHGPLFATEKVLGNGITSRIVRASAQYPGFGPEILEIRIYGIESTSADPNIIPGLSYSIYAANGEEKNIIINNGDKYTDEKVWGFGNKMANLSLRQIDTRDETGHSGFDKDVILAGAILPLRIRKGDRCCLNKTISLTSIISSCYIPKSGSTINVNSRLRTEEVTIRPLDGFKRTIGQALGTDILDALGNKWDQEEKDDSLEEPVLVPEANIIPPRP